MSDKNTLDIEEQQLKIQELKLKVKDMSRPDYLRPTFWTSIFAILIAVGGLIGQNILSTIKHEQIKLDIINATREKEVAERLAKKAQMEVNAAERRKKLAEQDYAALQHQKEVTEETLNQINSSIADLTATGSGTASAQQKIENIQSLTTQAQKELRYLPPRVYIQYYGEQQREAAQKLASVLQAGDFIAPGIENVAGKVQVPKQTEVRYFRLEDAAEAQKIISLLRSLNLDLSIREKPVRLKSGATRPRHYEVWFSTK